MNRKLSFRWNVKQANLEEVNGVLAPERQDGIDDSIRIGHLYDDELPGQVRQCWRIRL